MVLRAHLAWVTGCPGGVYPLMSSGCSKAWPICKKIVTAPQIFPYLLIYIRIRPYLCIVFHGIRFKVSEDWLSRDNQFFVSCLTHISPKRFPPKISIYISPAVRQLKQAFLHECPYMSMNYFINCILRAAARQLKQAFLHECP